MELKYNGRKLVNIDIEFGGCYIDDCRMLSATWADNGLPLTDDDMETLHEDEEFQNQFQDYIWDTYPERYILAMDQ